jgi:hypothetical protein
MKKPRTDYTTTMTSSRQLLCLLRIRVSQLEQNLRRIDHIQAHLQGRGDLPIQLPKLSCGKWVKAKKQLTDLVMNGGGQ